jgi:hypothetical protein
MISTHSKPECPKPSMSIGLDVAAALSDADYCRRCCPYFEEEFTGGSLQFAADAGGATL